MIRINPNNIQKYNCAFGSKNTPQLSSADECLAGNRKYYEKQSSTSLCDKVFGLPTLTTLSGLGLSAYLISSIVKVKKFIKQPNIDKIARKNYGKSYAKKLGIASIICILANFLCTAVANKNYDKNLKKQQDYFKSINQTNAKLSDIPVLSSYAVAQYDIASGNVSMNRASIIDPIQRLKSKYLLKHELVHAKQFELIARSEDGIKKLNFASMKKCAKLYIKNSLLTKVVDDIYNDIMSEQTDKYYNAKIYVSNSEVDFKKFFTAMHILIHDKNADMNSIPLVIDAEHYQDVIDSMPPLTSEEKEQAEKYYQAYLEYPTLNFFKAFNPFGAYRNNLLEKEAYKENPWWTRII